MNIWRKVGATVESIEHTFLAPTMIPVPPKAEQIKIINFIKPESPLIYKAIAEAEREIELIKEYRTTLISDVVTGKVDVREATSDVVKSFGEVTR